MVFPYQRKPRICVLTYKALTGLVLNSEARFRERADIVIDEYVLEDAMFHGHQLQQQGDIDVVVSAGYNAAVLRSQIDLPVASIEVTGFDLLQALKTASRIEPRVGLVVYRGSISELEPVRDLLKVELEQLTYETPPEARECMLQLKSRGIQVVVGSSLIVGLAEKLGMRGVLFYTASSIDRALEKAVDIGENGIRLSAKFENLNAVMAHLHEAILAVDMRHRITAINLPMREIIGCDEVDLVGQRLPDVTTELSLAGVLDGQADEPAEQQVVLDLLDELPLAAHAVQHLQQHGPHELLRGDARAAAIDIGLVHGRELGVHLGQCLIDPGADRAQRVVGGDKVLQPHRREQTLVVAVGSSHRRSTSRRSTTPCSLTRVAVSIGISTAC